MGIFSDILDTSICNRDPYEGWDETDKKIADTGEVTEEDIDAYSQMEEETMNEYAADSAYEDYTGIVLDPEDQVFKTVSGSFHDKKDFYEKLTKRGFVVRKVFEKRVFDWIERNAKTTLEAYLMFSTAFSKWKGNNLLDPYYVKLLNDIPQLNREKIKGDPNSIGNPNQKEESVLDEDVPNIDIKGRPDWKKYQVTVTPVDNPANELVLSDVRFDPAVMALVDKYRQLNKGPEFLNAVNKMLRSSREFVKGVGDAIRPVNRDTEFQFYKPQYDNKSPKYIPVVDKDGNPDPTAPRNPSRFNIKINGNTLLGLDDTPFVLTKQSVANWYNDWNLENFAYTGVNPMQMNMVSNDVKKQNTEFALLNAAADLEKFAEISNQAEVSDAEFKRVSRNLCAADPKSLAKGPDYPRYVSEDEHNKALEFDADLQKFVSPNITDTERRKLWAKYGAESQAVAINNLKKQQKEFYDSIKDRIETTIPDSRQDQIAWLDEYIDNVERNNLSDNYTKLQLLTSLRKAKDKLEHPANVRINPNKLKTNYSYPTGDPNAPRTQWINPQVKGAKAKHTTTQADLGVNQGINGKSVDTKSTTDDTEVLYRNNTAKYKKQQNSDTLGNAVEDQLKDQIELLKQKLATAKSSYAKKQTENLIASLESKLNKKESGWGGIVNTLKEERCFHVPVVDDNIIPCKYVNHGAGTMDADLPVNGVITSPGASFKTGGTFLSEEDAAADPQWDNRAHDKLNQDLFDGTHLRPEVREALLRIASKFQNSLGLNIEPVDVYFTGSGANFNYNEMSDIDLHLVYDFEQIGINAEVLVKYFIAKKQVFNNDYEITIKGMPVEVGVENINEPIVSSAIYSVVKDQWMLEPKDAEHLLPKPDMKQYYEIVQRIEDAIESRNSKKIGDLWDELYKIRRDSLAHDGEYGHGNGLFKKLRNLGYLDRLKHAYYSSASEELSLEALKEII